MERDDVCILLNSTPKYFFLLPFNIALIRRYAPTCQWTIYFATEVPDHPLCAELVETYGVRILSLPPEHAGFLESRRAALEQLREKHTYCLPLQEDFLLEQPMNDLELTRLLGTMDADPRIASARLMPCPGPDARDETHPVLTNWKVLTASNDSMGFVFQATLWRTAACHEWYETICKELERIAPVRTTDPKQRKYLEITANLAENARGQAKFWDWSRKQEHTHIAWIRRGPWPNAVYLSPFPYRPTAVVRGTLEEWAIELGRREGVPLTPPTQ